MLGAALFSCSFSTISVAALCQAVLCVDHSGGGRNEINMKLSPQLAMQPTLMQAHLNYVTFNSEFDIIGTKGLQQFAFNKYVHL